MQKIILFIAMLFCFIQTAIAQNRQISGKVTSSEDGSALPGVNIVIKGTATGTSTGMNGDYKLNVPESGPIVLVFSFIGMESKEVTLGASNTVNVTMGTGDKMLQTAVVIGYGSQVKREVTGAISTIKSEDINRAVVPSFEGALQGRASGVQITTSSGVPGGAVNVRVRGTGSISGGSDPLYIIDGIPVITGSRGDGGGGISSNVGAQTNPLNDINPNDIESIEVLKDAAAAAIYGARGGNGVVLITTKRGKLGSKPKFTFNYQTGVQTPTNRLKLLDGPEYLKLGREAIENSKEERRNGNKDILGTLNNPWPQIRGFGAGVADTTNVDYLDKVLRTGKMEEATFSVSGGTDKTSIFFSGNYRKDNGILVGNDFEKISGRVNIDHSFSDKMKVGANVNITYSVNYRTPTGTSNGGGFGRAQTSALPIFPIYNPDQSALFASEQFNKFFNPYGNAGDIGNNIVAGLDRKYLLNKQEKTRTLTGTYVEYKFLPNLRFRSDFGLELYSQSQRMYQSRYVRRGNSASNTPNEPSAYARLENVLFTNLTFTNTLNFNKQLNENHYVDALIGNEYQKATSVFAAGQSQDFAIDALQFPLQGASPLPPSGSFTGFKFAGYFARANYKFKDRYLLGVSSRLDGSSRFGEGNRYGFFPGVSAGWIISEEDFLRASSVVNFLKLRASWGKTGSATGLDNFQSLELWRSSAGALTNYAGTPGLGAQQIGNKKLRWEKQNQIDLGVEYGLWNNRVSGSLGYYSKTSEDMLLRFPGPPSIGFEDNGYIQNAGSMRNQGVEFSVSTQNLTGELKWSTDFNFTRNWNKVLDIAGLDFLQVTGEQNIIAKPGEIIGTYYMARYAGVNPTTGNELIYDTLGNPFRPTRESLVDSNRVVLSGKSGIPKIFGGFENKFSYKGFELTALVTYNYGNWILDEGERRQSYLDGFSNLRNDALNRWTKENPDGDYPKLLYNDPLRNRNTTRFLHDGSYVRLRTVTFAYNFPTDWVSRVHLGSVRVYFTGMNLLTLSSFPGWDPEAVGNNNDAQSRSIRIGVTNLDLPQVKQFIFGVNIGF